MDGAMTPIPIPDVVPQARPGFRATHVGPPRGISDTDCGTPEVMIGRSPEGYPMYCDYWRPTPEQLEHLANGGFIELIQYAPQMAMHSMAVWPAPEADMSS